MACAKRFVNLKIIYHPDMHHGAVLCINPIHRLHPDVVTSAKPAMRIAQFPVDGLCNFDHSHGPAMSDTLLPNANNAITPAPSIGLRESAATSKAEYNNPQGISAHKAPITNGALRCVRPVASRTFVQTIRAISSNHAGC
jgi:hypothetical protein